MDSALWSIILAFAVTKRMPKEVAIFLRTYDDPVLPTSYLQHLDSDQLASLYQRTNGAILRGILEDKDLAAACAFALASAVEYAGELTRETAPYATALCISRRLLVPKAHLDLNWIACLAYDTIPLSAYPVPLYSQMLN